MRRKLMLALAVVAGLSLGCSPQPEVTRERGAGNAPIELDSPAHAATTRRRPDDDSFGEGAGEETVREVEIPAEVEEPEPDLSRILRDAYGYPAECLASGAFLEGRRSATIRLAVTVTETGIVTTATVSASGLNHDAVRCLEARADRLHLPGPIPAAPRVVSASFEATAPPVIAVTEDEPPPRELPPGAEAPGVVLPAVVGSGPAPGAQAPGVVLPAVVGSGPAAGSRPADTELPARGGSGTWTWISDSAEARGDVPDNWDDD